MPFPKVYNEAFCLLQRRRRIVPVSTQAENVTPSLKRDDAETQMDMSTDISSHNEQEPISDPFVDSIQEGDNVQEEEVVSEVGRIVEDLENGIVDTTSANPGKSCRCHSCHRHL